MRNAGMYEAQAGIKIARRNISNIRLDVAEETISELKDGSVTIYIYKREKG